MAALGALSRTRLQTFRPDLAARPDLDVLWLQADLADIQQQRTKLQGAQQELQVQVSRLQEEAEDLRAAAKVGCLARAV